MGRTTNIEKQKSYVDFIKQVGYGQLEGVDVTYDGYPLSVKEAKFIDMFIGHGNLQRALRESGLTYKNVVGKDYIVDEITHRLDLLKSETIADATEVMQYLTRVMRGQEKDQFGLDAPLSERTNAAKELAKRLMDIQAVEERAPEIKITLNWEGIEQ